MIALADVEVAVDPGFDAGPGDGVEFRDQRFDGVEGVEERCRFGREYLAEQTVCVGERDG